LGAGVGVVGAALDVVGGVMEDPEVRTAVEVVEAAAEVGNVVEVEWEGLGVAPALTPNPNSLFLGVINPSSTLPTPLPTALESLTLLTLPPLALLALLTLLPAPAPDATPPADPTLDVTETKLSLPCTT